MNLVIAFLAVLASLNVIESSATNNLRDDPVTVNLRRTQPVAGAFRQISDEDAVKYFMKTNQALEAFIMRKKFEVGERLLTIIHNMKLEKKAVTEAQASTDLETDYEKSYERAASFLKAYADKGWNEIKTNLAREKPFIKAKVMLLAMNEENVPLIRQLFTSNIVKIDGRHYDHAIRLYRERGIAELETIIDLFTSSHPELGTAYNINKKLNLGFAMTNVVQLIIDNNYPMLERALNEGLEVNTVFPQQGNLLSLSVIYKCPKCVKILAERGADVNAPILHNQMTKFDMLKDSVNPVGWTPLMVAVADGKVRIVKHLIESGRAFVSLTPKGREAERFHARAVARMIVDDIIKAEILKLLKLNSVEKQSILARTIGKTRAGAIQEENFQLVDDFMLLAS